MLLVLVFLMPMQVYLAAVSGQVLDREGKPIAAAAVVYKNIGTLNRNYQSDAGMRSESPTMTEGTGRVYQGKTDKKGAFSLVGLEYGVYEITITAPDGTRVYSGKKTIGDSNDPSSQNVLNVDLSAVENNDLRVDPGGGAKVASGKKTKAQVDLIRQENARAVKINRLVEKYHAAVAVQDWVSGVPLLQQLIALDPNRWEFYQNLGTLQANIFQYQEAAETYAKGVEVAKKVLANPSDTDHALTIIGDLLLAEADCYARLQKPEDAAALYDKAAAVYPHPYMAHYRACNLLSNQDKPDQAIDKCNQAIADDPTQWGPYQLLGSIYTMTSKPKDALEAYEKGVATAQKSLEAQPDTGIVKSGLGQMLNSEGNLLLQLKRPDDAIAVFVQAAKVAVYPAMPYFNLCAIYYNQKRSQDALAACDQALSSDPTMADAYYIKGSILFGQGREERGQYVVPPGTIESLNNYLKYAPFGDHARVVQDMIKQTQAAN
jgi:tetratricopeptide (TPR) repeat protein